MSIYNREFGEPDCDIFCLIHKKTMHTINLIINNGTVISCNVPEFKNKVWHEIKNEFKEYEKHQII